MKSRVLQILLVCVAIVFVNSVAYADSFTFSTLPINGNISGPAGSTIGWGYTIVNLSLNWLVTTNLSASPFLHGVPDAFLFDFPIVAPGATATVAFNSVGSLGLFGLKWNANAPNGFTNSGTFIVSAEFWDGDPFTGGSFLETAADQSAPYTAGVAGVSAVPEPPTFVLLGLGVAFVFAAYRKASCITPALGSSESARS